MLGIPLYMGSPTRGLVFFVYETKMLEVTVGTPPEPYRDSPVGRKILHGQLDIIESLEVSSHGVQCGFCSMSGIHWSLYRGGRVDTVGPGLLMYHIESKSFKFFEDLFHGF